MNPKATPAALQTQVSGSSFYAGMRVLPRPEREAMYAIYAFCRAVDDIADDQGGDRAGRAVALQAWRDDIDALYAGRDPGQAALVAEAVRRFDLERADFHAVIDGMAMDVAEDICWPPAATLDLYCDRVASAVGRLGSLLGPYIVGIVLPAAGTAGVFSLGAGAFIAAAAIVLVLGEETRGRALEASHVDPDQRIRREVVGGLLQRLAGAALGRRLARIEMAGGRVELQAGRGVFLDQQEAAFAFDHRRYGDIGFPAGTRCGHGTEFSWEHPAPEPGQQRL